MPRKCHSEWTNRRQEALEHGLTHLMHHKTYSEITVKDICEEAGIPRRTFYHYFEKKEDVLESIIIKAIHNCYLEIMLFPDSGFVTLKNRLVQFFIYWKERHHEVIKMILLNNLESRIIACVMKWILNEEILLPRIDSISPHLLEMGLMVKANSLCVLLFAWCKNGYSESPEEMAECYCWTMSERLCMN